MHEACAASSSLGCTGHALAGQDCSRCADYQFHSARVRLKGQGWGVQGAGPFLRGLGLPPGEFMGQGGLDEDDEDLRRALALSAAAQREDRAHQVRSLLRLLPSCVRPKP